MKIERIDAFALQLPLRQRYWGSQAWGAQKLDHHENTDSTWQGYPPLGRLQPEYADGICTVIVKIVSDTELVGWGEAKAPVAPRVAETVVKDLLANRLLGRDPRDVVPLWENMYSSMRLRGHSHGFLLEAISGVDMALWDLLGKSLSTPVYRLLGGAFRRSIPVYASAVRGLGPEASAEDWKNLEREAAAFVDRGFAAMKMAAGHGVDVDLASARRVREVIGEGVELYVDAAERYSVPHAVRLARGLEEIKVGFLESPLPAEDLDGYSDLAGRTSVPIANDLLVNRHETLQLLLRRGLGLAQPDVCRAGGITGCQRIAQLTDVFGVPFQPHVSLGSAIHFAASLHLAAATPNLFRMEFWAGENPLGESVLKRPLFSLEDGCIRVPEGPGLGFEVDEEKLLEHVVGEE